VFPDPSTTNRLLWYSNEVLNLPFSGSSFDAPPVRIRSGSQAPFRRYGLPLLIALGAIVIVVVPALYGVAAILGIAALLFFLARPYLGICALTFCVPFESVYNLHAGGVNLTVTNFVVFCVAVAWLTRGVSTGDLAAGITPWRAALLIYGAVLIASLSQATDFVGSAKELLKWGQMLFAYMIAVSLIRTRKDLKTLLAVMFVAVITESAVGMAQVVLHSGPGSFARGAILRGSGTFAQPNPFAGYLNTALPLAVCCLIFRVFPRHWMWLVTIVTAAGVLGSLSRGGELAAAAALITIALATTKVIRGFLLLGVAVIALVGAGVVAGVLPTAVVDPVTAGLGINNVDVANPTEYTWSTAERLAHMEAGLNMFADHWWLGVGIGNYPAQYDKYRVAGPWDANLGHAHNYYINIAAEAGAVGLAAYLFLFGSGMVVCVRSYRQAPDALGRAISLGGLAMLVGFSCHQFFDDLLVHGMEVQIGLIMAMVTRAGYGLPESPTSEPVNT